MCDSELGAVSTEHHVVALPAPLPVWIAYTDGDFGGPYSAILVGVGLLRESAPAGVREDTHVAKSGRAYRTRSLEMLEHIDPAEDFDYSPPTAFYIIETPSESRWVDDGHLAFSEGDARALAAELKGIEERAKAREGGGAL